MRTEQLFEAIGEMDETLLERSECTKKVFHWQKWGTLAACACIVLVIFTMLPKLFLRQEITENSLTSEGAAAEDGMEYEEAEKAVGDDSFSLNGKQYIRADGDLLAARHIQEEQVENLSDKNLGDRIGIIEEAADESLIGCEVYSLADVLEQEDMYIVVKGEEYLLYVLWQ